MNIYKRRWVNALKVAAKINRLLRKGYIVLNEYNEVIPPNARFKLRGDELILDYGNGVQDLVFKNNKEFDDGYYTPIIEFNKKFEGWKFIKPNTGLSII